MSANKKIKVIQFCLIVLFLTLVACGAAQKQPPKKSVSERFAEKVDPQSLYPNELYITATGSGDTQDKANKNAINGVAQVIKVDLKSQQQLVEKYFETGAGKDMLLEATSTFTSQIELITEQTLKNVNIGKTWLSQEDGRYYAFAYMDRAETAEIYTRDIANIDGEISIYYGKFISATDKLTKLAYLHKALNLSAQREAMNEQLTTITQGARSIPPAVKSTDLISARFELTKQIKVKFELDYEKWDEFAVAVEDVLASFGFQIVDVDPDVLVSGKMTMERLERKGFFIRWFVELHFTDVAAGTEFLTYDDDDREGHKSYAEAERRAASHLSRTIKKNLYRKFEDYLNSLMAG